MSRAESAPGILISNCRKESTERDAFYINLFFPWQFPKTKDSPEPITGSPLI
ncbi:unnamed protein product [Tenebrio molitor]|nr:unnamed protein product [Tenebrio molitor]